MRWFGGPAAAGWAVIVLLGVSVPSSAQAASTVASGLRASVPIAALQGRVIWSKFDARRGGYVLRSRKDGQTVTLRHRPQRRPFDVDLGTDRHGHIVATYSRCRSESTATNCDAYSYSFAERRERRIPQAARPGIDETRPSMWRGRTAFAQRARRGRRLLSALAVTRASSTQQLSALSEATSFTRIDFVGTRVAYAVGYPGGVCDNELGRDMEADITEIRIARIGGDNRGIAKGCPADAIAEVSAAGIVGGVLFFFQVKPGKSFADPLEFELVGVNLRTGSRMPLTRPFCLNQLAYDVNALVVLRQATCGEGRTFVIERVPLTSAQPL